LAVIVSLIKDKILLIGCGFAQVGQTEKTSAFVLLSSAVRADRMLLSKRTNNQFSSFVGVRSKVNAAIWSPDQWHQ
jgi:hypothetical protein